MLLHHVDEGLQQPLGDVVRTVVVVAVLRELALGLVVVNHAGFVADSGDLGILQRADGVNAVREASDTGREGALHMGIDQRHFSRFVVVLVVHVVDQVQHVDIQASQPVEHTQVSGLDDVPSQFIGGDGRVAGTNLGLQLLVHAAVDGVQQRLQQVRASTEELHLLAGLGSRHAAADGVVVAPDGLHHVIVLILDGRGDDGDVRRVLLEGFRQTGGVQNGHVGFRRRAHVFQRVQEAIVVLGDHGTAVQTSAADFQRRPDGVAGEQLLIGGDAGELDHTELHDDVVNQLLRLGLGDDAVFEVTLDINVEEGGDTADRHCSAVLGLDGGQIAEVQPLERFVRVAGGLGDVVAVGRGHDLHVLQGVHLQGDFLTLTDNVVGHRAVAAVGEIMLLFSNQHVDAVQRNTAIVAHDTAAAIGVRQTGDDVGLAGRTHFRRVCHEDRVGVRQVIFGEDLVQFGSGGVAVLGAGLFRHADAAERHESALQRLVRLKTHDLLQILQVFVDVAGLMGSQGRNNLGVHIQDAALGAFFLLQLLQSAPQLVGRFGRADQEGFVTVVRLIVLLDKVANVDFFLPDGTLEAIPLLKIVHDG